MKYVCMLLFLFCNVCALAQEKQTDAQEEQLETAAEDREENVDDDSYWQSAEYYKRHHLNLNYATEDDLKELHLLTALQIESFLRYRQLIGKLISIYELQAVPLWDVALIKNLLPYITVNDVRNDLASLSKRFVSGSSSILFRYGKIAEQAKGFKPPANENASYYAGSRNRLYVRYKYNYNGILQYGILGAKDAGEEFFKGSQKNGFDFYSFHLFAKNIGKIKQLALGDFTVNMGQGLIQWQSLAFGKSAAVLNVKREASFLRPYNSSGSYNFHRGIGVVTGNQNWSVAAFISKRKLSGNIVVDSADDEHISSFQTSGYHRTLSELNDKNSMTQLAVGGSVKFEKYNWHIAVNMVDYHFSKIFQKEDKPYNLFALSGKDWSNSGIDYSYTYRNMHMFGEFAVDKHLNKAFVNGLLVSVHSTVDVSLLYRSIDKAYQSLYANAFTENTAPSNEKGMYAGLSLRPSSQIRMDAYADVFSFPWLKYLVDAPSGGKEYFLQFTYVPNKKASMYVLYKSKCKQKSFADANEAMKSLYVVPQNNLRFQARVQINDRFVLTNRIEALWYDNNGKYKEQGFLMYVQADYKPGRKISGNARLQHFETDGYNSRIYTYESDMLYSYSIPEFFDKGFHYYVNCRFDIVSLLGIKKSIKSDIACWLKWSQTIYADKNIIGSGLDVIQGNKKSEIKAQVIMSF